MLRCSRVNFRWHTRGVPNVISREAGPEYIRAIDKPMREELLEGGRIESRFLLGPRLFHTAQTWYSLSGEFEVLTHPWLSCVCDSNPDAVQLLSVSLVMQ